MWVCVNYNCEVSKDTGVVSVCNTHYLESSKKNNTISKKENTLFYITRTTKYEYHEILRGAILEGSIF